jgi:CRP/FNR family transcriptional regulator
MSGDLVALDISTDHHQCNAIALEDSEACVMPFDDLAEVARTVAPLQLSLHRFLSREIGRDQQLMLALGRLGAEERSRCFSSISTSATAHAASRRANSCSG